MLELRDRYSEDDVAVHLDEAPIGIEREARVRARPGESLDGAVVEAEVEDRLHHSGIDYRRAGPYGHEQRLAGSPNIFCVARSSRRSASSDLRPEPGWSRAGAQVLETEWSGDGEPGRDGDTEICHLGEDLLPFRRAPDFMSFVPSARPSPKK
jgi:hypothetical protein